MNRRWRTRRLRWAGVLLAVAVFALAGSATALAQSVPVTVEIEGPEQPTGPAETPTDEPTEQTSEPTSDEPSPAPTPTDPSSPAPPAGEEPPPAAADPPPDEPLARTGADTLRIVRDGAALIAAGLLLLITTRKPERTAR